MTRSRPRFDNDPFTTSMAAFAVRYGLDDPMLLVSSGLYPFAGKVDHENCRPIRCTTARTPRSTAEIVPLRPDIAAAHFPDQPEAARSDGLDDSFAAARGIVCGLALSSVLWAAIIAGAAAVF